MDLLPYGRRLGGRVYFGPCYSCICLEGKYRNSKDGVVVARDFRTLVWRPDADVRREKTPITLTPRGSEVINSIVDWFSQYEIKVILPSGKSVLAFRHAIYDFEDD